MARELVPPTRVYEFRETQAPRDIRYENITSRQSIIQIANMVSDGLGRQMTKSEFTALIGHVKSLNYRQFEGKSDDEIRKMAVNTFLYKLEVASQRPQTIDIHETLRREIGSTSEDIGQTPYAFGGVSKSEVLTSDTREESGEQSQSQSQSQVLTTPMTSTIPTIPPALQMGEYLKSIMTSFGVSDPYMLLRLWAPESITAYVYMYLDSRYREQSTDGTREIVWVLHNSGDVRDGTVNYMAPLRDIIEMEVSEFFIPYVATADTQYRRVSLLINEIQHQSVICHEGRRWHFLFDTTIVGSRIRLTPTGRPNRSQFKSAFPITKLDKITVTFGNPLQPIVFDTDRLMMTPTYGINPIVFTTLNATPHNLVNNDLVYFQTFTTLTPLVDATLIAQVNNANGWPVTVLGVTSFSIPLNAIGTVAPLGGGVLQCYFGSKRIEVPIRFTFLRPLASRTSI